MSRALSRWLSVCALLGVLALAARAADQADPKKLEEKIEKILEAYNKDDFKKFFTGWTKAAAAITTEPVYDALYKNGAKKEVGDYKAKTAKVRKEGSVLEGETLVVYFNAEFSNGKGLISVNFQKEDGEYKFVQVLIQKAK